MMMESSMYGKKSKPRKIKRCKEREEREKVTLTAKCSNKNQSNPVVS